MCWGPAPMLSSFMHEGEVIARFLKERFHGRSILVATHPGYTPGLINT